MWVGITLKSPPLSVLLPLSPSPSSPLCVCVCARACACTRAHACTHACTYVLSEAKEGCWLLSVVKKTLSVLLYHFPPFSLETNYTQSLPVWLDQQTLATFLSILPIALGYWPGMCTCPVFCIGAGHWIQILKHVQQMLLHWAISLPLHWCFHIISNVNRRGSLKYFRQN